MKIIDEIIEIAKKSDMRTKHGCIILDKKGTIISKACNTSLNISKEKFKNFNKNTKISYHAEENALKNVDKKKLYGARLYVVRYGYFENNPEIMNSKPCEKCTRIINNCMKKYGLKYVYYSL